MKNSLKKIDAYPRSINEILNKAKFSVDYYQREYKWENVHVADLLTDLETTFFNFYNEIDEDSNEREDVKSYGYYFLGSIVVTERDGIKYIVDGQQRLTTLILLLIFLKNLQFQQKRKDKVNINNLIYSEKYGKKSFNLEDPDDHWREKCFNALYLDEDFNIDDKSETIRNIVFRYRDIEDLFPESLQQKALPFFIEWLMFKVQIIEIIAATNDDAYTIFETMNDRGLSLKPVEMLKGFLLSNIKDHDARSKANNFWKDRILELNSLSREEDSNFIKSWFRGKYAETIRERKKNAVNRDFERIGTEFHKWLRDIQEKLALKKSKDFEDFILKKFDKFSKYYKLIREASETFNPKLEYIYYNGRFNFTLQFPLILAPVKLEDDDKTIIKKIRLVSAFIDMYIARRIINYKTIRYSSIQYTMFTLMKEIRDLDPKDLTTLLKNRIEDMDEKLGAVISFKLHSQNKKKIHNLLARMTYFIEDKSNIVTEFEKFVSREIKKPFEVEHIWSIKYDEHKAEFKTKEEFLAYRQNFGNLVLLPKDFNQSFGADPYNKKILEYFGQNILAKSLNKNCYDKNPSFLIFLKESGLPFKAHDKFEKIDLDTRQALYQKICEYIWNPEILDNILSE